MPNLSHRPIRGQIKWPLLVVGLPCGYVALPVALKWIGFGFTATLLTFWVAVLLPICIAIAWRGSSARPARSPRSVAPWALFSVLLFAITIVTFAVGAMDPRASDFKRFFWIAPFVLAALWASVAIAVARSPKEAVDPNLSDEHHAGR